MRTLCIRLSFCKYGRILTRSSVSSLIVEEHQTIGRVILPILYQHFDSNIHFSAQAVIWFLARWVATYLLPLDTRKEQISTTYHDDGSQHESQFSRKILLTFAVEHNQVDFVLDSVVRISVATLTLYPGENELQVYVSI